jgi:hypothetical protein
MRLELSQLQLEPHKFIIIARLELSQLQLEPHKLKIINEARAELTSARASQVHYNS